MGLKIKNSIRTRAREDALIGSTRARATKRGRGRSSWQLVPKERLEPVPMAERPSAPPGFPLSDLPESVLHIILDLAAGHNCCRVWQAVKCQSAMPTHLKLLAKAFRHNHLMWHNLLGARALWHRITTWEPPISNKKWLAWVTTHVGSGVHELTFRRCTGFSAAAAADMASTLHTTAALRTLDLGKTVLGDNLADLAPGLRHTPQLRTLFLPKCGIGPIGANALAAELPHTPHLQRLDLARNPLGAAGFTAVMRALGGAPELKMLKIDGTSCGPGPATAMCEVLPRWPRLEQLDVQDSSLGNAGVISVITLLWATTTLTTLNIGGNGLQDGCIAPLARLIPNTPYLRFLGLGSTMTTIPAGLASETVDDFTLHGVQGLIAAFNQRDPASGDGQGLSLDIHDWSGLSTLPGTYNELRRAVFRTRGKIWENGRLAC